MQTAIAPQTGRLDRHVRQSYLRIGEGASRHRISYALEEALRLSVLPGEEEGRIYCFRRVRLEDVAADANRRVWIEQVQNGLGALAVRSVHASDPRATDADAMYFNNLEEALEILLGAALRTSDGGRPKQPEWFANSLLGLQPGTGYSQQIPAILERLRSSAIAPSAAAAILFAALDDADPAALLAAIPAATMRAWVRELEGERPERTPNSVPDAPIQLPERLQLALRRAATQFGWKEPATVWLATQAILCTAPSLWIAGAAVRRARSTLRQLEMEQRDPFERHDLPKPRARTANALVFDGETQATEQNPAAPPPVAAPRSLAEQDHAEDFALSSATAENEEAEIAFPQPQKALQAAAAELTAQPLLGESTTAAGLYFLLNALQRVGIAAALEAYPALAEAGLAMHILKQLAIDAGVAESDPILRGLDSIQGKFLLPAKLLADPLPIQMIWPAGFAAHAPFSSARLLRAWTLAVRRWCWRGCRMTVREIIHRPGRVWLTRTDLDVTLPLAAAEIRIRRIGLDIDPGWLPWLGASGRVVRFHYRELEKSKC